MKRDLLPADAIRRARALRRAMTPAERRLWLALCEGLEQARFRRQVPLGPYFADFCSHSARIVVEVDGSQHGEAQAYDAARTRFIEGEGYRVLRFWNNAVSENLEGVLTAIAAALPELPPRKRMREAQAEFVPNDTSAPTPLPPCGGERREAAAEGGMRAFGAHPHPSPPHKGEGVIAVAPDLTALRAQSLRDCNPLPSLPHLGGGGIVNPPVWSL